MGYAEDRRNKRSDGYNKQRYGDLKIKQIDPLAARLIEAGHIGGASKNISKKANAIKLKRVKKIIQKTPNKLYKRSDVKGKDQKKKAIQEQRTIVNKMDQRGDVYTPPFLAKGGRAQLRAGGAALRGLGRAFVKGGKV